MILTDTGGYTFATGTPVSVTDILTVPNTGLHILDTNATHDLIIKPGSNLTADRTFTITTGDTDMIVDFTAVTDEYVLAYDTATNTWRGVAGGGGSGVTTMGAIGASANANGATITGSTLNLEPASASFGGVVTTGTQTFAGAKTFSSSIVGSAGLSIVGAGSFSASSAGMVFGGATTVYSSVSVSTSAGSTLATGIGSARVLMGTATVTTFTSGTHPLIAGLVLKPQTITNAGATVTNTATLYVESEGAGGTNNYAAWFDSGAVRIDGTIELGAASDTTISRSSAGVIAVEGNNVVTANLNASSAEINTGTSTTKFNTPDSLAGSYAGTKSVSIAVFAPTTDVATGDGKAYITIPEALNGMDLIRAQATVVTAGTTNATTVMINNVTDAVDMLSGAISIASGGTVGTVGTINTSNDSVATNDILRVDVDSVSTTAPKGLMVILEFRLP